MNNQTTVYTAEDYETPRFLKIYVVLFVITNIISGLSIASTTENGGGLLYVVVLLLTLVLAYFLIQRKGWARRVTMGLTMLAILQTVSLLFSLLGTPQFGAPPDMSITLLAIVILVFHGVCFYWLYDNGHIFS